MRQGSITYDTIWTDDMRHVCRFLRADGDAGRPIRQFNVDSTTYKGNCARRRSTGCGSSFRCNRLFQIHAPLTINTGAI